MNDLPSIHDRYLAALALTPDDELAQTNALRRAHELRKFEIENYWKRATYFWAFQLAAFALLGLLWGAYPKPGNMLLIPALLGVVASQVGWLSARGSKFWQENWEAHVDMLEQGYEGRLTQVIFVPDGPRCSVSRLNERFFLALTIGWVCLFVGALFPWLLGKISPLVPWIGMPVLIAVMFFIWFKSHTRLEGWVFQKDQDDWSQSPKSYEEGKKKFGQIFLRDTNAGRAQKPVPMYEKTPSRKPKTEGW